MKTDDEKANEVLKAFEPLKTMSTDKNVKTNPNGQVTTMSIRTAVAAQIMSGIMPEGGLMFGLEKEAKKSEKIRAKQLAEDAVLLTDALIKELNK